MSEYVGRPVMSSFAFFACFGYFITSLFAFFVFFGYFCTVLSHGLRIFFRSDLFLLPTIILLYDDIWCIYRETLSSQHTHVMIVNLLFRIYHLVTFTVTFSKNLYSSQNRHVLFRGTMSTSCCILMIGIVKYFGYL